MMTTSAAGSYRPPEPVEPPPARDVSRVSQALQYLVGSAQPAITFSSLAKLCVPVFSDTCVIAVRESAGASYVIDYPRLGTTRDLPSGRERHAVTAHVNSSVDNLPSFQGTITHSWQDYAPTASDAAIAQFIADQAVAAIRNERLADLVDRMTGKVSHLELALQSNRQIGAAVGILMSTGKLTYPAAFDLLRTASQRHHRKLHDIADEVVATGWLEPQT